MANPVVELRGVYKTLNEHEILHDINLEVREGEFLTLLGPVSYTHLTLPTNREV